MARKNKEDYIEATATPGGVVDQTSHNELRELEKGEVQRDILVPKKFEVRVLQDDGSKRVLLLPSKVTIADVVGKNRMVRVMKQVREVVGFERAKIDTSTEQFARALGVIAFKSTVQEALAELLAEAAKVPRSEIEDRLDEENTIAALLWYFHFWTELFPPIKPGAPEAGK